ncbi:UNVERIFIED_CONTAM: hypothetical protein PYX00_001682 [Menopon gallinae]|uniref:Uncharacterized protein n=1 Tax=Menopon gallinae TaxID=328185 RepID=A0AAW2IER0_9NEOP
MRRINYLKNYLLLRQFYRNGSSVKNVLFGGYISPPPDRNSVAKVLFERLSDPARADKVLQICSETGVPMTTKTFLKQSVGVAESLRERNIRKGDSILIVGNNSLNMNIALTGILIAGAVAVPISYFANPDDVRNLLTHIQPKFFICDGQTLFTIRRVVSSVLGQVDEKKIVLLNDQKYHNLDLQCFPEFISGKGEQWESFKPAEIKNPDEELVFILKSLVEGAANRGVMISHSNLLSVIHRYEAKEESLGRARQLSSETILMVQKTIWMSGIYSLLMSCLFGTKLIVMSDFDEEAFLKCVEKYKVTICYLYPTKLWQLFKHNYKQKHDLSSFKSLYGVGPNVPRMLVELMKEKMGLPVTAAYGMTEMSGVVTEPRDVIKSGSAGKLVPMCYGKVVDLKTKQKCGPNAPGELCFKGPCLMRGYINDDKAMREIIDPEGFLRTGIYGYYDADEHFYILDKVKEVVRFMGKEVAPLEIEGVLKTHDSVKDCVVSAIQHPKDGHYVVAFVVLQPGKTTTAEEIKNYVADKLPEHKHLKGGVVFIPKVPRSRESGFIKRSAIHKILSKYRFVGDKEEKVIVAADVERKNITKENASSSSGGGGSREGSLTTLKTSGTKGD